MVGHNQSPVVNHSISEIIIFPRQCESLWHYRIWCELLFCEHTIILHQVLQGLLCFQLLISQSLALNFSPHTSGNTEWPGNIWPIVWVSFSLIGNYLCRNQLLISFTYMFVHSLLFCSILSLPAGSCDPCWEGSGERQLHWVCRESYYRLIKLQCSFMELNSVPKHSWPKLW